MSFTTLITAAQLQLLLERGSQLVVLDASADLADTDAGERMHAESHIPGARHVHLERELSGPKNGRNGRHPLPPREVFASTVAELGIDPDTQVVIYDRQGAMYAVRLWWMLRWLGHSEAAVLDGGLQAWSAVGGVMESGAVARVNPPAPYPPRASLVEQVQAQQVAQRGERMVLDARAGERFRGEVEPLDAKAGHIPGARHRFFKDNLNADGCFKPAAELRAEFIKQLGGVTPEHVIHQCGSGVTACHNLLAMEIAGLHGSVLYPGSWSEWSSDTARPVEQG